MMSKLSGTLSIGALLLMSCQSHVQEGRGSLFLSVDPEHSGVTFNNEINESNQVNFFTYEYLYNGGGVAAGDINNDGFVDLYFTGNFLGNKLYLNKGDLQFDDVSGTSGTEASRGWSTGVTMVDINLDGWLDIYVCRSGIFRDSTRRANLLYINQRDGTFQEAAADYGLRDTGFSTQATFFDYDRDGDLDVFVANHPDTFTDHIDEFLREAQQPPWSESDHLYRNDLNEPSIGRFTEVTQEAGLVNLGHSLGLVASDFNNDGWPDLYVSNDYYEADHFYFNNGDGTFSDRAVEVLDHMAKFSMGVDAADFNNDGHIDLMAVEMMAEDNLHQKTNMAAMNPQLFERVVTAGFGYQYMHNMLQLNTGLGSFQEVSYLAGVATTDWSWAPLFADFDNDGDKDLFISNGYKRDFLDKDFRQQLKRQLAVNPVIEFERWKASIPSRLIPNYAFRNDGDLTFTKASATWGLSDAVNSNGVVYADLDNDGDLDLVTNNIDAPASIYENRTKGNFVRVNLRGQGGNPQGLGAKIHLWQGDDHQLVELTATRGFQSSVVPVGHFGLGAATTIDSLKVIWPEGGVSMYYSIKANQTLTVEENQSEPYAPEKALLPALLADASHLLDEAAIHKEQPFDDYSKQVLLPHKLSQTGPGLAVADVNGDGLEDFYLGGAAGQAGRIFLQQSSGQFVGDGAQTAFNGDRLAEDQAAVFFDVEGDGDPDLYVASGSYEFEEGSSLLQDRLYINEGQGHFSKAAGALPSIAVSSSVVAGGDYDADGDIDLFVGGRLVSGAYPSSPGSHLLINDGGVFRRASEKQIPLRGLGMVTSALWTDFDNDQDLDLMVVGEWMPITLLENDEGTLTNQTQRFGLENTEGWWNSVIGADLDNDGDTDYILGNLGLNSKNQADPDQPFTVYGGDYNEDGHHDIILGYHQDGQEFPVRGLQCSSEQIPELKSKIGSYREFGSVGIDGIYSPEWLEGKAERLEVKTFASAILSNDQDRMELIPLPRIAQLAPTTGVAVADLNGDGCLDLVLVGNQFDVEVETGRYDAHRGLLLLGDCQLGFRPAPVPAVRADARALALVGLGENQSSTGLLIATNDGPVRLFQSSTSFGTAHGARKEEYYYGGGYLSQSSKPK